MPAASPKGTVERCEEDFYLRPDGSREWVRWEVHPFRNRLGDIAGITVFSEFVTARKDAELRLAQSEQRLREVLTSSSDWLWETDEQHRFVLNTDDRRKSNVGQSRVLWRTRWELAGVADPQAHPVWRDHLADLEAHRPFRKFEYSALDDDGVPAHLEVSGAPIFDDQGTFRGYRGTACNITAHKEAERRLAQSEQRLREVLTSSSDWLWETDEQNRFVLHTSDERPGDAGYERRLGHTPWELAGVEDPQSDPAWRAHLADLEARRPFRKFEYTASADDGTRVYCEVNGTPIFDEDGSFRGYRGTTCTSPPARRRSDGWPKASSACGPIWPPPATGRGRWAPISGSPPWWAMSSDTVSTRRRSSAGPGGTSQASAIPMPIRSGLRTRRTSRPGVPSATLSIRSRTVRAVTAG